MLGSHVPLVHGHTSQGVYHEFVHRCPGKECAVLRWAQEKSERLVYQALGPNVGNARTRERPLRAHAV